MGATHSIKHFANDHIESSKLLSGEEAAKLTGLCYRSLYTRRVNGEIGYVRFGRLIKYRYEDLMSFVEKNLVSVSVNSETKSEALAGVAN